MRILLIRHAEPDYEHDSLTEKGFREARLLADHIEDEHIDVIYKSPMGRAQRTAFFTEKKLGITGITKPWLREFPAYTDLSGSEYLNRLYPDHLLNHPENTRRGYIWDGLPRVLEEDQAAFDAEQWRDSQVAFHGDMEKRYTEVTENFDSLLAQYGYERDEDLYHVRKENRLTLAFFCHFGVSSVIVSHLIHVSPFILWQNTIMRPSSVTELITEEREEGVALFRVLRLGDVSHLRMAGEEPSFMGRFTDIYSDPSLRH